MPWADNPAPHPLRPRFASANDLKFGTLELPQTFRQAQVRQGAEGSETRAEPAQIGLRSSPNIRPFGPSALRQAQDSQTSSEFTNKLRIHKQAQDLKTGHFRQVELTNYTFCSSCVFCAFLRPSTHLLGMIEHRSQRQTLDLAMNPAHNPRFENRTQQRTTQQTLRRRNRIRSGKHAATKSPVEELRSLV